MFVQELQQIKLQVCKELKFLRNLTQNPNQCGTSLHNGEIAWRDMSMSEDGNPVCTYSGANSCKKFGFVTTSIELNEHDF